MSVEPCGPALGRVSEGNYYYRRGANYDVTVAHATGDPPDMRFATRSEDDGDGLRFSSHSVEPDGSEVRIETMRGREWLVAPVVLVREGVLNGGFLPFDEIKASVPGWNGRPITVPPAEGTEAANLAPDGKTSGHPIETNDEGEPEFVSANQPPFIEDMVGGHVQNAEARDDLPADDGQMSARGLVGEAWLDVERLADMGEDAQAVVKRVAQGDALDVSTGYFHRPIGRQGRHDGEQYERVQTDIMPDHLAMLPNETGACSWPDGCGVPRAPAANGVPDAVAAVAHAAGISPSVLVADGGTTLETMSGNHTTANAVDSANLLATARTPEFEGRSSGDVPDSWPPSLSEYASAFGFSDVSTVEDLTDEQAARISETTLLGDPEADTFGELRFFPVVQPSTMSLQEGALEAVISGRGAQADISDEQLASARRVAYELLNDEFDRDLDVPDDLAADTATGVGVWSTIKRALGIESSDDSCSPGPCSCGKHAGNSNGGTDEDDDGTRGDSGRTTNNEPMNGNYDIETLAERTAFDAETLDEWDEDDLAALAETVEANDGGDGGGSNDDGSTDDTNDAGTDEDTAANAVDPDRIEALEQEVEALRNERDEVRREQILTHSDLDEDDLDALTESGADLETLAERLVPDDPEQAAQANAGPQGNRANYVAQGGAQADPDPSDEDAEALTANVGALAAADEADAANQGGD